MKSSQFKEWLSFFNQSAISMPMVVFGVLAIAVLAASTLYQDNLRGTMQGSVEQLSQESQIKATARLEAYALLTRSSIGLIRAGEATNAHWNAHLNAMKLDRDYPSILAIGYGRVGSGPIEDSISVRYIYPDNAEMSRIVGLRSNRVGESIRQTALEAAKTGQVRLAEAAPWHSDEDGRDGYFLYLFTPVYKTDTIPETEAERLESLIGMVFVVSDFSTLLGMVYQDHHPSIARLEVSQAINGKSTLLFALGDQLPPSSVISERRKLDIMGQQFIYDYDFTKAELVPVSQRYVAVAMPFFGLVVSLLFAMVLSFTLRARNQRQSIAREREVQAAKDELLSLASHQLRTPATGVKQYLGMVIQGFAGKLSDTQRDFLERAYASNERQLHIINDILYLAKLDAGRIVITKTKFDLSELVRSVKEDLEESARESELTLRENTPKKAAIKADEHMLRMVIENLVTNAIKYTAPGGEIEVHLIRAGDNYAISVTDNGVGIATEDIPKLFQQFTRIPNERSNQVSGTGVGLYLARSLARLHDGDVTVKSKLGQGTTFTITIPRGL